MKAALVTASLLSSLALGAAGSEPIDPLTREEGQDGAYTWQVGLGYTPVGSTGGRVDALGVPYEYTQLAHGVELSLAGTFNVSAHWKTGIEVADTTWLIRERRIYPQETVDEESRKRGFAYTAFGEARLAPGSALDPRATLSVGAPRQTALDLSVSVLRDPLALFGRLGYARLATAPEDWLSIGFATAFVANAWISVKTSAGWEVPLAEVALPRATLGLLVQYDLDLVGDLQLRTSVTLHVQERCLLSFSLQLAGRGG